MTNIQAVWDLDFVKYAVASKGEKRSIKAYHPISGDEFSCATRTELWGHYLKKNKGLLAEFNLKNGTEYKAEELVVIDIQEPEPFSLVSNAVDGMFRKIMYQLKTKNYSAYIGEGKSFRVERSTIWEYKSNRKDTLKPLHLEEVSNHLIKKYSPEVVTYYEADDRVVMDAYRNKDKCVIGVDKDYFGCDVLFFNANQVDKGIQDCSGLGSLYLNTKGEVKGIGRLFFYHQILSGDSSDNYKANSANPEFEWGDKSSYKLLKDCKTDKEALEAIKQGYQLIYPEPKTIDGWKGDEFEIDWKYVFNENWDMARMLRWENDVVVGTDVMRKLGVIND